GYGAPNKQGTSGSHGAPLGADEVAAARQQLGWSSAPFEIPNDITDAWRLAGLRSSQARCAWQTRLDALDNDLRIEFDRRLAGELPTAFATTLAEYRRKLADDRPALATRNASQDTLDVINAI